MPFYLFKGSYTTDSLKAMVENPHDREAAVKPMMDALGAKLHHLFFCFGKEDVIALIEAPDDETMAAGALVVGASGSMSSGETVKLMTSAEAMAAMGKAGKAASSYKPAS